MSIVTLGQLANASKDELDELEEYLEQCDSINVEWLAELMPLVAQIPWHCGNPACVNEGCNSIRKARAVLEDILGVLHREREAIQRLIV